MLVVECRECGEKLIVPDSKPTEIVCDHCGTRMKLSYQKLDADKAGDAQDSEPGKASLVTRIKDECKNAATGVWDFTKKHYKEIISAGVLVILGAFVVYANSHSENDTPTLPENHNDHTPEDTPDETSNYPSESEDSSSNDEDSNEGLTDWDYLSYLTGHCYNCGSSLSGGLYTAPWEDGDNEYGYWECPYCGAINEDWNSADDD